MAIAGSAKYPFPLILLATLAAGLLASWLLMFFMLLGQGETLKLQAMAEGRYARIDLATGRVDGNLVSLSPKVSDTAAPANPTPPSDGASGNAPLASEPPVPAEPLVDVAGVPPLTDNGVPPEIAVTTLPDATVASTPPVAVSATQPAPVRTVRAPLNTAPNTALNETVGPLILPKKAEDGLRPADYYKKPFTRTKDTPEIAVVIRDLGLHAGYTNAAVALDEFVTLSYSPYAPKLLAQSTAARAAGHELWLQVPMEPEGYPANDAGPYALLRTDSAEANLDRLHQVMSTATGYVGLVAPPAEIFSSGNMIGPLADDISARGLLLLQHQAVTTLPRLDDTLVAVSRTVQPTTTPEQLRLMLSELESIARTRGFAVLSLPPSPGLLAELPIWLDSLAEKKLSLAPLSAVAVLKTDQP
ncbi:MAG: divergent polysaccharide deacetylase family protein [Rickettsiales bacterium]|nr:divergent polysaccharide deacetylase family protein [Rickettsiales bacterium]